MKYRSAINFRTVGKYFFAIAFIGLGVKHFLLQDFVIGRAPAWPDSVPGKLAWAYLTGAAFIVINLAILFRKKARSAAIIGGFLIFVWAFLRNIPIVAGDSLFDPSWTQAGKALAFFGGSFAIAGILPKVQSNHSTSFLKFINQRRRFIVVGQICLGIFFLITGIQHFIFTDFVDSLIPGWFPGNATFWTYFAGIALIGGGVGLFIPQTAKLAALLSGLMVFSWFWIIHLPRTFVSVSDGLAIFEALAVSGIAFVIAGTISGTGFDTSSSFTPKTSIDK